MLRQSRRQPLGVALRASRRESRYVQHIRALSSTSGELPAWASVIGRHAHAAHSRSGRRPLSLCSIGQLPGGMWSLPNLVRSLNGPFDLLPVSSGTMRTTVKLGRVGPLGLQKQNSRQASGLGGCYKGAVCFPEGQQLQGRFVRKAVGPSTTALRINSQFSFGSMPSVRTRKPARSAASSMIFPVGLPAP